MHAPRTGVRDEQPDPGDLTLPDHGGPGPDEPEASYAAGERQVDDNADGDHGLRHDEAPHAGDADDDDTENCDQRCACSDGHSCGV